MAFLESTWVYSDGERIPIRWATSRKVTAASPSRRAISHAASSISRRVSSRRSALLSRLGKALMVRQYPARLALSRPAVCPATRRCADQKEKPQISTSRTRLASGVGQRHSLVQALVQVGS